MLSLSFCPLVIKWSNKLQLGFLIFLMQHPVHSTQYILRKHTHGLARDSVYSNGSNIPKENSHLVNEWCIFIATLYCTPAQPKLSHSRKHTLFLKCVYM